MGRLVWPLCLTFLLTMSQALFDAECFISSETFGTEVLNDFITDPETGLLVKNEAFTFLDDLDIIKGLTDSPKY